MRRSFLAVARPICGEDSAAMRVEVCATTMPFHLENSRCRIATADFSAIAESPSGARRRRGFSADRSA
jgi:hypothetical protein